MKCPIFLNNLYHLKAASFTKFPVESDSVLNEFSPVGLAILAG